MAFYDNFVYFCAKKGISPSAAAQAIGLSNAAANGWKKGKQPSDVTIAKLCKLFECTAEDLKKGELAKDKLSDVHDMLIEEISSLSDADASVLLILARQLRGRPTNQDSSQ